MDRSFPTDLRSHGGVPMDQRLPKHSRAEQVLGALVLLLLLIGSFLVLQPFLSAMAWAFVMGFSLWPVHRWLVARVRNSRTLAPLIITFGIALVLLVPTLVIVANLAEDAHSLGVATKSWIEAGPATAPAWIRKIPIVGERASNYWQTLANDASAMLRAISSRNEPPAESAAPSASTQPLSHTKLGQAMLLLVEWARYWVPVAGLAILHGATQITLSVFLTFFIFRDGAVLGQRLGIAIQRIAGERGSYLLHVAGSTVRGVVYGILGTALVQGVLASIGLLIAGVPGAALLGFITFVVSPLPMGPPLVWIPASLWLFHQGATGWGIFMLIWGVGISSIDNVVKPLIIS